MMRRLALVLMILAPFAAADDAGVIRNEEENFELRLPKYTVDWTVETVSEEKKKEGARCHLRTVFADSDPEASAEVWLYVYPLLKDQIRKDLPRIAKWWGPVLESHLANPRDRTEVAGKFGEVDNYRVDVKGDHIAGIHQRTWYIAKNGRFLYLLFIDRTYRAVGDEDLDDELKQIVGSFKFLRVEKVEINKAGKGKGGVPDVAGPKGNVKPGETIDPELLKKETFKEPFWRFSVVKPNGLLKKTMTANDKKRDTKFWFEADRQRCRLSLRVYAQTERAKRWTIGQLMQHKLGYWDEEVKVKKDPKIDKNYKKYRLAKKAIRLDLIGRAVTTIRRIYILMDCKNDRQYQLEIRVSGTAGLKVWGKTIEEFLKNFKPFKK